MFRCAELSHTLVSFILSRRDASSASALGFTTYDAAAMQVTSIQPPGGPTGNATTIAITGGPFADFGAGELVCAVDAPSTGGGRQLLTATLVSAERVLCIMPPLLAPQEVEVSAHGHGTKHASPSKLIAHVFINVPLADARLTLPRYRRFNPHPPLCAFIEPSPPFASAPCHLRCASRSIAALRAP